MYIKAAISAEVAKVIISDDASKCVGVAIISSIMGCDTCVATVVSASPFTNVYADEGHCQRKY